MTIKTNAQLDVLVASAARLSDAITGIKDYRTAERLIVMMAEIVNELTSEYVFSSQSNLEAEKADNIRMLREIRMQAGLHVD